MTALVIVPRRHGVQSDSCHWEWVVGMYCTTNAGESCLIESLQRERERERHVERHVETWPLQLTMYSKNSGFSPLLSKYIPCLLDSPLDLRACHGWHAPTPEHPNPIFISVLGTPACVIASVLAICLSVKRLTSLALFYRSQLINSTPAADQCPVGNRCPKALLRNHNSPCFF